MLKIVNSVNIHLPQALVLFIDVFGHEVGCASGNTSPHSFFKEALVSHVGNFVKVERPCLALFFGARCSFFVTLTFCRLCSCLGDVLATRKQCRNHPIAVPSGSTK